MKINNCAALIIKKFCALFLNINLFQGKLLWKKCAFVLSVSVEEAKLILSVLHCRKGICLKKKCWVLKYQIDFFFL